MQSAHKNNIHITLTTHVIKMVTILIRHHGEHFLKQHKRSMLISRQRVLERGFSLNSQSVDDIRIALKERTIIALCTVKDVVNRFDNVDRVQITSQLIRQFRGAYATYKTNLESVAQDKDAEALTKFTEDKRKQTTEIKK